MDWTKSSRIFALLTATAAWPARAAAASLPRLAAIVIGPNERVAIFVDRTEGQLTVIVTEGSAIGPCTVQRIDPQAIVVVGPAGVETWALEHSPDQALPPPDEAGQAPALSPLQVETLSAGTSIAQLAIERDS